MAGQQGQPKYGFGWPDGRLGGLGPPGQREARPLHFYLHRPQARFCFNNSQLTYHVPLAQTSDSILHRQPRHHHTTHGLHNDLIHP